MEILTLMQKIRFIFKYEMMFQIVINGFNISFLWKKPIEYANNDEIKQLLKH